MSGVVASNGLEGRDGVDVQRRERSERKGGVEVDKRAWPKGIQMERKEKKKKKGGGRL